MVKKLKKTANITIQNFNRLKKSCIVVKSKLYSFVCGLIIALSFKENVICGYVRKNSIFKLKNWQRKCQPKRLFKTLNEKLVSDATKYLKFVPTKIRHWRRFMNYLGFNLVIYCANNHFRIINEKDHIKRTFFGEIYLLRCDSDSKCKYHYDVIRKPNGYFGKFICTLCFKSGKNKTSHICKYKCIMCKSEVKHDKQSTMQTSYCKNCHRYFYNKSCKNIHIRNKICDRKKMCLKCDNLYIVNIKKPHQCYSKDFCKSCQCIHPPRKHYIKGSFKPPPHCEHILIFDFETFNNSNNIVTPYLCVSRLYNITDVEEISDCVYQEKIFYGIECAKEFFTYLISGLVPLKTICFAHNGQSFDLFYLKTLLFKPILSS